jgi:hypothetical protein
MGNEPTRKSPNESERSIADDRADDLCLSSSSSDDEEEYPELRASLLVPLRRRGLMAMGSDAGIDMGVDVADDLIDMRSVMSYVV